MIQLSQNETRLLNILESHGYRIDRESIQRGHWSDHPEVVWMGTAREFELSFEGERPGFGKSAPPMKFSAFVLYPRVVQLDEVCGDD